MGTFKLRKIIKGKPFEYSHSFLTEKEAKYYANEYNKLGLRGEIIKTTSKSIESEKGCVLFDVYLQAAQQTP